MTGEPLKPPEIKATGATVATAPGVDDYAVIVGKQAVQTESVYTGMGKAAAAVTATAPLTPVFQTVARKAPIIGAVISAAQAVTEVKTDIHESKYAKAGVATVAGVVEVIGNIAGFGIGDSAREIVRGAAIKLGGEGIAVEKSDLRTATETVGQSASAMKTGAAVEDARLRNAYLEITSDYAPKMVNTQEVLKDIGMSVLLKPPKP